MRSTYRMGLLRLGVVLAGCAVITACQSPQENLESERREAQREVSEAASEVRDTEVKAAEDIADADTKEELEERKLEATEDLAEAERELDDEKVEATEEVAEAKAEAGQGGTYQKD